MATPIIVPNRRKRSVNVTTLPDETSSDLTAQFQKYDEGNTGFISRDDIMPLIFSNSIYNASEDEVSNTMLYLTRAEAISRDEFLLGYHRVSVAMGGVVGGLTEFKELSKTFNMELQCISKSGRGHNLLPEAEYQGTLIKSAEEDLGADCVAQIDGRFASLAEENGTVLTRHDIGQMLRACYFPGKEKIDLVMNFFEGTEDKIPLINFLHGMTLLYGDLTLLADASRRDLQLASDSNTPLGSPSAMFDGSL